MIFSLTAIPLFFAPYLAFYVWAKFAAYPVSQLATIFQWLHVFFAIAGTGLLLSQCGRWKKTAPWIAVLFLFFLIPGVYLEYPTDPWAHLDLILGWQRFKLVGDSAQWTRFPYFWGYSVLKDIPTGELRFALSAYSAFWQTLLAIQIYLFARTLGFERPTARLQTAAFVLTFGTGIFSLRYYALAPALFSQIAVLSFLGLVTRAWLTREKRPLLLTPFPLLAIGFSHAQGYLLLAPSLTVFALLWGKTHFDRLPPARRQTVLRVGLLSLAAVILAERYLSLATPLLKYRIPNSFRYFWGGFRPLGEDLRISSTLGVHGALGLVAAAWLLKTNPLLALLSLAPFGFLMFPLTASLLALALPDSGVLYRLLYAFPLSFALVAALKSLFAKRLELRWVLPATLAAVLLLSLIVRPPWYGRLWFQIHRVPPALAYEGIETTAAWLKQSGWVEKVNRGPRPCYALWANNVTSVQLESILGIAMGGDRRQDHWEIRPFEYEPGQLVTWLMANGCQGALLVDAEKAPVFPRSWTSALSKHWPPSRQQLPKSVQRDNEVGAALFSRGWTRREVPPYFQLYERPQLGAPQ